MTRVWDAAGALLAGAALASAPAIDELGADAAAAWHARWRPARAPTDVALVAIDARALRHAEFASRPRASWGAPVAAIIERLLDAGATVVALDVVLPRADAADAALLRALRRGAHGGRILLGAVAGASGARPSRSQVAAAGGAGALVAVNLMSDASGRVRELPVAAGGLPLLGAAAAVRAGAPAPTRPARLVRGALPAFTAWSAADVLDCAPPALVEAFAGRIVVLGAWLPREDRHASAVAALPAEARAIAFGGCAGGARLSAAGPTAGLLLHALAADRWLHRTPLVRLPAAGRTAALLAAALLGAAAARCSWRARTAAVAAIVLCSGSGAALAPVALLPWLGVAAAAAAAATVTLAAQWLRGARRAAASLPRAFRAGRAPETRPVTACFIDLASFTRASEAADEPTRIAADLGRCLRRFDTEITRHGGFVDKYLGDGLFALFGLDDGDGRREAVAAVRACMALCAGADAPRLAGHPVSLRAGLAWGVARVGALHDGPRLHFTAVGDVVNVAARLEQLNRALGSRVLAAAEVAAAAPGEGWTDHGEQSLRGRERRVRVFELTGR